MTVINQPSPVNASPEVLIRREIPAPRDLVFAAWLDQAALEEWYAPHGCSIRFHKFDCRTGGSYLSCISHPSFGDCWCTGEYLEVNRPRRIVMTMAVCNSNGERLNSAEAGHDPEWPNETTVTVHFEDIEGRTVLTLQQTVSETLARRTGAYPSWLQMLDRLAQRLDQSTVSG